MFGFSPHYGMKTVQFTYRRQCYWYSRYLKLQRQDDIVKEVCRSSVVRMILHKQISHGWTCKIGPKESLATHKTTVDCILHVRWTFFWSQDELSYHSYDSGSTWCSTQSLETSFYDWWWLAITFLPCAGDHGNHYLNQITNKQVWVVEVIVAWIWVWSRKGKVGVRCGQWDHLREWISWVAMDWL